MAIPVLWLRFKRTTKLPVDKVYYLFLWMPLIGTGDGHACSLPQVQKNKVEIMCEAIRIFPVIFTPGQLRPST
jgi:hypothetical protein